MDLGFRILPGGCSDAKRLSGSEAQRLRCVAVERKLVKTNGLLGTNGSSDGQTEVAVARYRYQAKAGGLRRDAKSRGAQDDKTTLLVGQRNIGRHWAVESYYYRDAKERWPARWVAEEKG